MGLYKYLKENWRKGNFDLKSKILEWRKQNTVIRIEKPTRIDKARRLGYKAKQGFVVVRVRVKKGGRKKPKPSSGRRPKRYGRIKYSPSLSLQAIAEQRANKKFPNLEVLNSYYVGDDSVYSWYEIIMVDTKHPAILKDKDVKIQNQRRRTFRGLTSAGKRARGLIR